MSGIPDAQVFQAIVDRIDSGVYAVDLQGKISYWNYGAEKISGFLSQEVLGRACNYFPSDASIMLQTRPRDRRRRDLEASLTLLYVRPPTDTMPQGCSLVTGPRPPGYPSPLVQPRSCDPRLPAAGKSLARPACERQPAW